MLNPIYFLMYATGEKINITQIEGQFPRHPFPRKNNGRNLRKTWIQVPDDKFKQYFHRLGTARRQLDPFFIRRLRCVCDIVDWQERMHYIDDALGMCAGLSSFPLKPPYHIHNYPKFISAGAGIDMDEEKLTLAAKRYRTLVRAINIRRGMRRKDDAPPANHWKKRFPELEKELLDTYYQFKGWNDQGIPTQAALKELGLDYVAEDFEKRGIYNDNGDHTFQRDPGGSGEGGVAMAEKKKKIIKTIKVDADKCNGCRACEVICSAYHAAPKYSSKQPGQIPHKGESPPHQRHLCARVRGRVYVERMCRQRQICP